MKALVHPTLKNSLLVVTACCIGSLMLGCMSKNLALTEQQERMIRCDKYIGDVRERCLEGELVTVSDYKEELAVFEQDKQELLEAEEQLAGAEKLSKEEKFEEAMSEAQQKAEKAKQQAIEAKIKENK